MRCDLSFWWCLFRWFLCMKRIVLARHDFNFTVVGDGSVAFAGRLRAIVGHQCDRWNVGGVRGDGGLWSPRYHHATTAVVLVSILGAAVRADVVGKRLQRGYSSSVV